MIYESLNTIKEDLTDFLIQLPEEEQAFTVVEDNIAFHDSKGFDNDIVLSVIRVEEEATVKNSHHYKIQGAKTVYQNAPVWVNLYVLFSFVSTNYGLALKNMANVVRFFQSKRMFNASNTPKHNENLPMHFQLNIDLYSPSFDMANQIWGTLGGRQFPFVMYKVRMASLERNQVKEVRPLITSVEGNSNNL